MSQMFCLQLKGTGQTTNNTARWVPVARREQRKHTKHYQTGTDDLMSGKH